MSEHQSNPTLGVIAAMNAMIDEINAGMRQPAPHLTDEAILKGLRYRAARLEATNRPADALAIHDAIAIIERGI